MGAGHAHALYVHGQSRLHALAPECKVAAAALFIVAVVATPREAFWAFAVHGLVIAVLARLAHLRLALVARRVLWTAPFIAFALFLPFVARGEEIEVLGVGLAVDGLWAAWNIVAKATLGASASVLLGATTELPDLLRGLERLRVPAAFTSIASFMIRYLDVISGEMRRMQVARMSRGHDPRWIWQVRAVASSAGALFIRSYERGERVHLAMLSRGFTGALPPLDLGDRADRRQWLTALAVPTVALVVATSAWMLR